MSTALLSLVSGRTQVSLMVAGLAALLATGASAQRVGGEWTLEHAYHGTHKAGFLGTDVAGPGDLNLDGYTDLLVGAPGENYNQGSVYAYSGFDGSLLWKWDGLAICEYGRAIDGAGDINADGVPDVVVGSECSRVYTLLSDGSLWWTNLESKLDDAVAGVGDINLDGFDDVIAGASYADPGGRANAGSAYVYSGLDGALIYRLDGARAGDRFGLAADGGGDVDADGYPDVIVGAEWADRGGLDTGAASVFSGQTGALIYEFAGPPNGHMGLAVSFAGDLNGDGHDEVMVSAPDADFAGVRSGSVYVYSGIDGSLLFRIDGTTAWDRLGWSIDSIADVSLDGVRDLVVGVPEDYAGGLGRVEIRSGVDGSLLDTIRAQVPQTGYAWSVTSVGDIDRNGTEDILVGAAGEDYAGNGDAGAAYAYSFEPFLYADATEISASSGIPVRVRLAFPGSDAFLPYALLLSDTGTGPTILNGLEVPLSPDPLLNKMLTGWAPPNVSGAFGSLDGSAQANATIASRPALSAYVGTTFYMAAVVYVPSTFVGRRASIAWPVTVVP